MLYIFYRISDRAQTNTPKHRPNSFDKIKCLKNFVNEFGTDNLFIIADCCSEDSLNKIKQIHNNIYPTNFGSGAFSFLYCFEVISKLNLTNSDCVYFVEDDYLHKEGSMKVLLEGLNISDYVSLYDHADKYQDPSDNPFIKNKGEVSHVTITDTVHWKSTNSTTMTFATNYKIILEDLQTYVAFCKNGFPFDFQMFQELINNKGRKLITPIPGYSTHCENKYLTPFINWSKFFD